MSHDNLGRRLEPHPMPEALKDAIATCYGLLHGVTTEDKRVHRARRGLLQWLTKDEQARGIEMARGALALSSLGQPLPSSTVRELDQGNASVASPSNGHPGSVEAPVAVDITGWKLVPDQPTEGMWQAGRSADIHPGDSYSKVWSAMFEAAPVVDDCETSRASPPLRADGLTQKQVDDAVAMIKIMASTPPKDWLLRSEIHENLADYRAALPPDADDKK